MTTTEAQKAYDAAGSLETFARKTGLSRWMAYKTLKQAGVVMHKRGGNRPCLGNFAWRSADAPRPICHEHGVPCILTQIGESCERCPRTFRHAEVGSTRCSTMEDLEATYTSEVAP